MPRLSRIRVYPIKSLDGQDIESAGVKPGAGLAGDREYQLVDEDGRVVNSKRFGGKLMPIRARFDVKTSEGSLTGAGTPISATMSDKAENLQGWFARELGFAVRLERNKELGFPDDEDASGPTIISEATLEKVVNWFPGGTVEDMRRRFRVNLEVAGVPAFWEDSLYGGDGDARFFQIGEVRFEAVKPCARCAVPSMDPYTGEVKDRSFAKRFARLREETLPPSVEQSRFDHLYRLSVNTLIPKFEGNGLISVGDELKVL